MASERERIEHVFMYHAPTKANIPKLAKLREAAKDFALLIDELCPTGREKNTALKSVEEAVMWANAAIARA